MANDEKNKKRTINHLLQGKRKTVTDAVVQKYNWTIDEMEILKPFIEVLDHTIETEDDSGVVYKKTIVDIIEGIENKYTKKTYMSRVNALIKLLDVKNERFSDIFQPNLIEIISDKYKDSTPYYGFLLYIVSKCPKLNEIVPIETVRAMKAVFEQSKNKQYAKYLEDRKQQLDYEKVYNHIFEVQDKLKTSEYGSMKHVISTLYTTALYDDDCKIQMNPRNYFIDVKLVDDDTHMTNKENFYNTETGRFLLNNYKTSGIYGEYDVYFTQDVRDIIKRSLVLKPRQLLVEKVNGGIYENNSLSEMITRILTYNIDTIRKSIESYEVNVKKTCRLHLANVSRHSILTQEISYLAK